jgi:hypothetical protein
MKHIFKISIALFLLSCGFVFAKLTDKTTLFAEYNSDKVRTFPFCITKTMLEIYVPAEYHEPDGKIATWLARALLGKYYSELDCSSLICAIYPQLPRTASLQFDYFHDTQELIDSKEDLLEGDLVFFQNSAGEVKHVGFVESNINGKVTYIHSSFYKRRVVEAVLGKQQAGLSFCGGGRFGTGENAVKGE